MKRSRILMGLMTVTLFSGYSNSAQLQESPTIAREWRITRVVPAPWATARETQRSLANWVGKSVQFEANSVAGPGVLHCDHATMEKTSYLADALFQGGLPAPADSAARELGIAHLPLPGVRLNCSTGSFEFHFVDAETLLVGLDNQILTLTRSPGTLASADSPEGRMQGFLEFHFTGDMGFDRDRTKAYRDWFSKRLESAIVAYFSKPVVEDEVPAIDGDPFTGSQSYPTRFTVGNAKESGDQTLIPIRFSDAFRDRTIVYVLLHEKGNWKLDDVRYEDGDTLTNLVQ